MSGYAYAGSRLATAADTAAAAAASSSEGKYDHVLPADEDALFTDTPSSSSNNTNVAAVSAAQQRQQRQQHDQAAAAAAASVEVKPTTQQEDKQQQKANAAPAADAAGKQAAAPVAAAAAAADEDLEKLTCVVCLEHPSAIAVGPCDHHQLCALCCLRMRMCYRDTRCPLCKTEAKQVVMIATPRPGNPVPSFEALMAQKAALWQKPKWAGGVMARPSDSMQLPGSSRRVPLHVRLLQMTAVACPVCDRVGQRPLGSMKQLQDHLALDHRGLLMCPTCVTARRKFPLELETYTPQALEAHQQAAHKHCEFCNLWFYAVDEVWAHMTQHHFHCSICQAAGTPHLYFKDAAGLREHYVSRHFPCCEGECGESGMVAFATEQELRDHTLERHSSKMPRFKRSNARQLVLDLAPIIPRHTHHNTSNRGQRWDNDQQQQQQHNGGPAAAAAAASSRHAGSSSSNRGAGSSSSSSRAAGAGMPPRSSSTSNSTSMGQEWPSIEAAVGPSSSSGAAGGASGAAAAATAAGGGGVRRSVSAGNIAAAAHSSAAAAAAATSSRHQHAAAGSSSSGTGSSSSSGARPPVGRPAVAAAAPDTAAAAAAAAAAARDPYAVATSLGEGGLQMIDDDVGMFAEDFERQQQQRQQQQRQQQQQQEEQWPTPLGSSSSSSSRNVAAAAVTEQFPELAAATAAAATGSSSGSSSSSANQQQQQQLVKATAKCPCGRRQMHLAVRAGLAVPSLPCDKECERQQRRHQIADAFGVSDADSQAAYWDKHRTPTYSPVLLQAYKTDPVFIEHLEQQFLAFMSQGQKLPRLALRPMPKPQRALVHEYAESGWGFVSHSVGSEPNRAVQVFKTPSSGSPTQLLSQAGVLVSQTAIDNMFKAAAANALTLRLTDVTPGANLAHHLREWAGEYKLAPDGPAAVLLTFDNVKSYKACSDALAGGIRGIFRVEWGKAGAAAGAGTDAGGSSSGAKSGAAGTAAGGSSHRPQSLKPAAAAAATAGHSRSAAAAPSSSSSGWQTVATSKASRSADAAAAAAAAAPVDPWADDETPAAAAASRAAAAAAAVPVADDWESTLEVPVDVPRGPALQLQQRNMWEALDME